MTPRYIVIHTSASSQPGVDIQTIDEWHRSRGWSGCGYHFVILDDNRSRRWRDGEVQEGRPPWIPGAHTQGLNCQSVGICAVGDGDAASFTNCQWLSMSVLCISLIRKYDLRIESVIGHHEVNGLVSSGEVDAIYSTTKTCPGRRNNMDHFRGCLRSLMNY